MDAQGDDSIERWIDGSCKVPVTLDDLPKDLTPTAVSKPNAYAFLVSSISSWPMPHTLKKKLEAAELDGMQQTAIACSVSMSFFHTLSKRFYGSTWVGHEHHFSIKSSTKNLPIENLNELVYFQSSICDPKSCFVVIELVMATLNPLDGSVSRRFGCGWALVNPFAASSENRYENENQNDTSAGNTNLYGGSPRDLLQLKGNGSAMLKQLSKKISPSTLSYTIWRPKGLNKIIASCIKENHIVGAHTSIAGLRGTTIHYFDERGSSGGTCIGATTLGNVLDWALSPPQDSNILASPCILKASNTVVEIPRRIEFERSLTSWVANALPKGNIFLNKMSSIFVGWNKSTIDEKDKIDRSISTMIKHRRLRIGVHNGHTILQNKWHESDLQSDVSTNSDQLRAKEDIEISRYVKHPCCALFCIIGYDIETVQAAKGLSPKKTLSNMVTVVVGVTVFCPMSRGFDFGKTEVRLNLANDARCQVLCTEPIYSPACDGTTEQHSLSFDLCACDNKKSDEKPKQTESIDNNAKLRTKPDDSISMDGSAESRFLHINSDVNSSDYEAKEECSLNNSGIVEDASTITFENSTIETPCNKGSDPVSAVDHRSKSSYSTSIELGDSNTVTSVTISFLSFNCLSSKHHANAELPSSLSFQLKLYSYVEIITNSFTLKTDSNSIGKFTDQANFSFGYDYSIEDSSEELAMFLMQHDLPVEVFADSKFHVGTFMLPMHLFLRQGKRNKTLENISVDIVKSLNRKPTGTIILSIQCEGRNSDKPLCPESQCPTHKRVLAQKLIPSNDVRHIVSHIHEYNGMEPREAGRTSHSDDCCQKSLIQQQLQAVEDFRRQRHKNGDSMSTESLDSFFRAITEKEKFEVESRMVNAVQWSREGKKKKLTKNHVKKSEEKTFVLRPWVGQTVLVGPYELFNPTTTTESFTVEANHPGVRLTGNCEGNQIVVHANEKILVPIAFDCIGLEATIIVSFVSSNITTGFNLKVLPRLRIDRRVFLSCSENENIKITVMTTETGERGELSLKCVDKSSTKGATCKWEGPNPSNSGCSGSNAIQVDFRCQSPVAETFYIFTSDDDFCTLRECIEFCIDVNTPLHDVACLGKISEKKIVLDPPDNDYTHGVKCFAKVLPNAIDGNGSKNMCTCEPKGSFQLSKGETTGMIVQFQLFNAEKRKILINMVDQDTHRLIQTWILSVQIHLPEITEEYNINVLVGRKQPVKLPFTNRTCEKKVLEISSSNEIITIDDCGELDLNGGETSYHRFQILVDEENMAMSDTEGIVDAFLFTRDVFTKAEECFRIRLHVQP